MGYDFVNRTNIHELENFKWYDEVLSKCFEEFNGNYDEFFEKIYEISEDTIDACLDKAKLYSKVYGKDMAEKYVEKLVKICPSNPDVKEFHDRILYINNVYNITEGCDEFKDYNSIEEYIEDVIVCIVASFPYYDEKKSKNNREKIRRLY
ncbi:MAG: hypothetical protein E7Z85_08810 [Methanosphaera stadtmanae]|nr:hypothetical protein [Methanosphaera stadtmanae]